MRRLFLSILLCVDFLTSIAQHNIYNVVLENLQIVKSYFLQSSTNQESNEKVYETLEELLDGIQMVSVSREERFELNSLVADIKAFKEFVSPISGRYNAHLTCNHISRLKRFFGNDLRMQKLNAKCPVDEVEFYEIRIGELVICYFHCISDDVDNGLRIKFYAFDGDTSINGEYGALKGEYTPIAHNVGTKYAKVRSATITERF